MPLALPANGFQTSRDLATAFGWDSSSIRQRTINLQDEPLEIARTTIAGENALIFASVAGVSDRSALNAAALFGYHVAADWGVLADRDTGIKIFNSRWSYQDDWYILPTVSWAKLVKDQELFAALTPAGVLDGRLSRIAEGQLSPSRVLVPVDDALVERLDRWRHELLKFSRLDASADDLLQKLYAQMFVLRTVEDRALDSAVPALSGVISPRSGELSPSKWTSLMRAARARIGGELFATDVGRQLPAHVVVGVINDLYFPRHLPTAGRRYDFSWMDADVLGIAYEKYLATVLQPGATLPQEDMFLSTEREVDRVSVRKKKGVFYTPKFITTFLASKAIDEHFGRDPGNTAPYVIDFACGSGAFLIAAVDRVLQHLKQVDPERLWAKELVEHKQIVGIDIDPNAVNLARLRIWQRLLEEPGTLPLPSLVDVVRVGDGLNRESWGELDRSYDVVLGNPPFLATEKVESRELLEARFATARGRYDFSSLFVEQAVRVLKTGGSLGMVVPNRFFRNTSGASLRALLTREVAIDSIVDFGTTRPFEAHAYVACLVAKKRSHSDPIPRTLTMIEVASIDCEYITELLVGSVREHVGSFIKRYKARHPVGADPWVLLSEKDLQARTFLEDSTVQLDSIALIAQGIKTGANDFFILEVVSDDRVQLAEVRNGLGDQAILERELLEPVVYGSELQRYSLVRAARRILYPYRNSSAISEHELRSRYPRTWNYFEDYRSILGVRASIKQGNANFYELVRPRDEAWLRRPKLLIRDLAPKTSFALDDTGQAFLVGGTAVAPEDSSLLVVLLAYLNSSFVNDYVTRSTPGFHGGYQKFEPKHLQSIPVLIRVLEDPGLQAQLTDLAWDVLADEGGRQLGNHGAEQKIDELICEVAREAGVI